MPFYKYIEIRADGSEGAAFEVLQSIHDAPLEANPDTGLPVRRVLAAPMIPKPFGGHDKKEELSDKNLEKLGFTKYVKGKHGYEKTAGDGPSNLRRPAIE